MTRTTTDITADAIALQERDEFRSAGWLKLIAPAKVNLFLGIGNRRDDGYHEVLTVMHAVNLHDVVYMRRKLPESEGPQAPAVRMVACGDVPVPRVAPEQNIAFLAACALADALGRPADLDIRIEKNIPAQAGLGGGSSDAAAVLVGAAQLWGLQPDDPLVGQIARTLGSDVAFFLQGGCALFAGAGEAHMRSLQSSRQAIALVKPDFGISTTEAYRAFDRAPSQVPPTDADAAMAACYAADVALTNNLAPAAELLQPQLGEIRSWLAAHPGVEGALLCGSGAATFALCDNFQTACRVVAAARKKGLWGRATSFGPARAMAIGAAEALRIDKDSAHGAESAL